MPFNFARRSDIEATLEMIRAPKPLPKNEGLASRVKNFASHGFILKTPSGGISAMTGTTPGKADCTVHAINADGELIELPNAATGDAQTYEVFNIFSGDVAGDAYITAKLCFNRLIVDAEDCG